MDRKAQLQFRLSTADAQQSAIRRLALTGLDDEEIARITGWSIADVRHVLSPPEVSSTMPWGMGTMRRYGSSDSSLRG